MPRCQALAEDLQAGRERFKLLNAAQLLEARARAREERSAQRACSSISTTTGRREKRRRIAASSTASLARLRPEIDLRVLTYQTLFRSLRDAPGLDHGLSRLPRAALFRLSPAACVRGVHRLAWPPLGSSRNHHTRSRSCIVSTSLRRPAPRIWRPRSSRLAASSTLKVERGGVAFEGTLEQAYRACLWSRVANRVLLAVAEFPAADARSPVRRRAHGRLERASWRRRHAWPSTARARRSAITHTQFAALKVKDAVVDQFRERTGARPSVDVAAPDVRVNLHLDRDVATLAIDLAGDSLHRRGYRGAQGAAPLKENLAAAMLLRAGWAKLVGRATTARSASSIRCAARAAWRSRRR